MTRKLTKSSFLCNISVYWQFHVIGYIYYISIRMSIFNILYVDMLSSDGFFYPKIIKEQCDMFCCTASANIEIFAFTLLRVDV